MGNVVKQTWITLRLQHRSDHNKIQLYYKTLTVYTYLNIQGMENNLDIFENNAAKFAISQDDITHLRPATELAINQCDANIEMEEKWEHVIYQIRWTTNWACSHQNMVLFKLHTT